MLDPRTAARGFETPIRLHSEPRFFEVQGLDSHGNVLGTSGPHADRQHLAIFTPDAFVASTGGRTAIPIGCLGSRTCTVRVSISSGTTPLALTSGAPIGSDSGSLVALHLSSSAQHALERAPGHHLQVAVTVHDSLGDSASTHMTLIRYSITGSGPPRSLSESPTIRTLSTNVFVSTSGRAGILAACYGSSPCHPQATLTANGTIIGTSQAEHLGTEELGDVYVQLNPAGKLMLEHAAGNQLGAELKLTSGADTATGQVDLIGYS